MPDAQAPRLVLGDPAAPVTITEYGDLECPYCRDAEPVLRRLVEESDGGVRLVWRHFPLFQVHPHALIAALAAEAAAEQGLFWEMQRLLFAQQDRLAEPDLRAAGARLGLDPAAVAGEGRSGSRTWSRRTTSAGSASGCVARRRCSSRASDTPARSSSPRCARPSRRRPRRADAPAPAR